MDSAESGNNKIIGIILVVLLLVAGFLLIFKNLNGKKSAPITSTTSTISGILDVNGVVPDGATLVLSQQETTSGGAPTDFSTINNPKDQEAWIFNGAQSGKNYQIRGTLKSSNGAVLLTSPSIIVSAPASGETLVINLEGKGLTGVAAISGSIKVNGYIPTGSTVTLMARTPNTEFTTTKENMPAQVLTSVLYDKAVAGQKYDIIGYLYDSVGTKIGESSTLSLVAPARNEVLDINSSATALAPTQTEKPKAKISGLIKLNGVSPINSRIVILQRRAGKGEYQVATDNVPANDGQGWAWTGATSGIWYDMTAVLKQRQDNGTDKDIASSNQMTLAAPAINVTFIINTGIAPSPTPTPTPSQ